MQVSREEISAIVAVASSIVNITQKFALFMQFLTAVINKVCFFLQNELACNQHYLTISQQCSIAFKHGSNDDKPVSVCKCVFWRGNTAIIVAESTILFAYKAKQQL